MKKQLLGQKRLTTLFYSLCLILCVNLGWGQTVIPFTTAGTTTWTCPPGVTSVQVEAWGGGGGGGGTTATIGRSGGGGGGGSYVVNTITVVPGVTYNVTVGAGGTQGQTGQVTAFGLPGGKSEFSGGIVTTITASGGTGGGGGTSPVPNGVGGVLGGLYGFNSIVGGTASYSSATTTVSFTSGAGSGASAAVSTGSNLIVNVAPTNMGTGYISAPTVTITSSSSGTGASAVALVNPNIDAGGSITAGQSGINGVAATSGGAGGAGGNGGAGGASNTIGGVGNNGAVPGGGGAGAFALTAASAKGGNGGIGKVVLTFTALTTNYYYNGTGDLSSLANWGTNTNGTGSAPSNFTNDLQAFYIRNTTAVTTTAPWTVSGSNSKIVLGDSSQPAVTLTVADTFAITGTIDIPAASSGSNSLVLQDLLTQPTFGILDNTSEVHLQAAITYTTSATFGKLLVDGIGSTTISGNPVIKTSLTVPFGSRLTFAGSSNLYTVINAGASVVIDGYLKIGKQAGAISFNVVAPGSAFGSLQFIDAVPNLTLGSTSTVEFARNNTPSSQSISILPTGVSYAKLIISDGNPSVNCPKSFAGPITVNDTFTLNQGASTLTGGGFLTLADNATFVRTIGSLDVAPIFGSTVNVTYDGAAAISSGVEIPVATTVLKNLKIDTTASAVVTLTSATNLNNKLTVNAGSLATGGLLTLKSSECCTAFVAKVLSPEATPISGNVIAERYIPIGYRAYRLLSPATTGGTINANWQEGGLVTSVGGLSNPKLTYGTHITGAGGSANGFDTTTSNAASIYTYNNASSAYIALANTSGLLTAGSPYLAYIRGSRLATNIDASLGNDATTLRTTGALTTGTVTVSGLSSSVNGFSIVGNPYQAQVDMNKVLVTNATAVNLASFYYVVDPKLGGKGAYATVDLVTPGNSTAVDANQYLQPGQACFVQTVAASAASLNFTEADKFEGTQTSVFRTKNGATARLLLTLNDASAKALDRLVVAFDANETNDVNQNDASKLTNFDESMATSNTSKLFAIEKRAIPTDTDEIPLNITKYRGTSYSIKAEGASLTGPSPYLFDQFANKTIEIPQDGSIDYAYTVDTAIPASIAADRFKLIYAKALKTIDNELAGFALYPNPSKSNSFSVAIPQSSGTASLTVSNMLGQQLYSQNDLQSGTTVKVTASNVKTSGVYLVSLTTEGKTETTKWIVE